MMLSATMRPISSITASSACLPEPMTRTRVPNILFTRDRPQSCHGVLPLPRLLSHRWLLVFAFPWSIPRREPLIQNSTDFSITSNLKPDGRRSLRLLLKANGGKTPPPPKGRASGTTRGRGGLPLRERARPPPSSAPPPKKLPKKNHHGADPPTTREIDFRGGKKKKNPPCRRGAPPPTRRTKPPKTPPNPKQNPLEEEKNRKTIPSLSTASISIHNMPTCGR